ncbi:histidine phosphatase family protein [Aquimarina sp. SS2-1]|uniref:SixA phosphatase family protein n=1 Tax=Aquimarina besae TaxID=3342247 RepID=UPI00366B43FA
MKIKYISVTFLFLLLFSLIGCSQKSDNNVETTTYILVRHSEKDTSDSLNKNPNLTEAGKKRSQNLVHFLTNVQIDEIYSTQYQRTLQTAEPLAKDRNIEITLYDPQKLYDAEFQKQTKGKISVIIGHSNTTPTFVNKILKQKKYDDIDENDYSKLFVIKITGDVITDMVFNLN